MKVLILTQYYPPEVGAPQNRLHELAIRLQKEQIAITVLTAMPNYPSMKILPEYIGKKYVFETIDKIPIHRSSIYVSSSKGILKRLLNYFSFVWSSFWIGKRKLEKEYDYILCESPPLFLGITAYLLSKRKKAKLIFNVSDLWPESAEKLNIISNKFLLKSATVLEEFFYKKAALVTGQTQGIVKNIQERFPNKDVYWLPNGVDISLYNPQKVTSTWRKDNGFNDDDLLILYAGIIGHAQGLELLLEAAEITRENTQIKYLLLGSGPEKEKLKTLQKQKDLNNVHFLDLVQKKEMPFIIKAIDISIVPLKKLDLFLGAIPSKIFENSAMEKPLLLGVDGEARELFIKQGNAGLFFEPENANDLANKVLHLDSNRHLINELGENGRKYVEKYFNRNQIAAKFQQKLQTVSNKTNI